VIAKWDCKEGSLGQGSAAWSPGGRTIAFLRDFHVWLVNPDGTNLRQLTSCQPMSFSACTANSNLVWSPDGRFLAFQGGDRPYIVDALTGELRPFLMADDGDSVTYRFAAWQPVPGGPVEPSPSPSESPTPSTSASPSPSPSATAVLCDVETIQGDFDGDGLDDVAAVYPPECTDGSVGQLQVTWSDGTSGEFDLPDCQSVCGGYGATDIGGQDAEEIAVLVDEGASTQFIEFVAARGPDEFHPGGIRVAPPGAEGFPPMEPGVFAIGGSVPHLDFVSCVLDQDGQKDLAASSATLSNDQTTYSIHETVFLLSQDIVKSDLLVQSTRDYSVPYDPSGGTDFQLPGPPCLTP
jgi:hypothetical protein